MPRGTTLANLRTMFRAEVGINTDETVDPAGVTEQNSLLRNTQSWLASKFDWHYLRARATVDLASGDRYVSFPSSSIGLERLPGMQDVKFNSTRYPITFGITEADLNEWDSDDSSQVADPVKKWDLIDQSGVMKIEVWPRPATAQKLILNGFRPLAALTSDTDTCDLDDLLIVLFAAAEFLARDKKADAQAKLAKAQGRLIDLQGHLPAKNEMFVLGGGNPWDSVYRNPRSLDRRPTVAITGN